MDDVVTRAARRAAVDPHFLAFGLHEFAEGQQMDESDLMTELGATPETLAHVRLCRTPRGDDASLKNEVARIAAQFGLNATVLLRAVRAGEVAIAHRTAAEREVPETAAPVLAARDRDDGGGGE